MNEREEVKSDAVDAAVPLREKKVLRVLSSKLVANLAVKTDIHAGGVIQPIPPVVSGGSS